MSAASLLADLAAIGCTLQVSGDGLRLRVPAGRRVTDDMLQDLRQQKDALRKHLLSAERDAFDERAAVAEFDGGMRRDHAEAFAALQAMPVPYGVSREALNNVIDAAARFLDRQRGRQ